MMSMRLLFEKLTPPMIKQVRSVEQSGKRHINATAAVQFNEICLNIYIYISESWKQIII